MYKHNSTYLRLSKKHSLFLKSPTQKRMHTSKSMSNSILTEKAPIEKTMGPICTLQWSKEGIPKSKQSIVRDVAVLPVEINKKTMQSG